MRVSRGLQTLDDLARSNLCDERSSAFRCIEPAEQQLSTLRVTGMRCDLSLLLALEVLLLPCCFVVETASILHGHCVTFLWLVGAIAWRNNSLRNTHIDDLLVTCGCERFAWSYDRTW